MIYVAFTEYWENTGLNIRIFHLNSWQDFIKWLNVSDPFELYIAESVDEISKYVSQILYCDLSNSNLKER